MPDTDLITIAEYAAARGLRPDAVRQRIHRGAVPEAVKLGRDWLIPRDAPWPDRRIKSGQYINWRKSHQEE